MFQSHNVLRFRRGPSLHPVYVKHSYVDVLFKTVTYSRKAVIADKLYVVIESVRWDTRHPRSSTVPVPADGAGGHLSPKTARFTRSSAIAAATSSPALRIVRASVGIGPPANVKTGPSAVILYRR